MSKYNIHAGHNPSGKVACGAVGLLDESVENRKIAKEIVRLLKLNGHTAYNCTVDNGTSQNDVLVKIVNNCNAHKVDYDLSIHLNSGRSDKKGDKKVGGFEVLVTGTTKGKGTVAARIRKQMKKLGFTDRGTKKRTDLYYLKKTNSPALLLEICFVDDKDDYNLYKKVGYKAIAQAIVVGLLNKSTILTSEPKKEEPKASSKYYPKYTGNSYGIDTVLKAIGVPEKYRGGYKARKPIAELNGIKGYNGNVAQNLKLINLAKEGKLKKL